MHTIRLRGPWDCLIDEQAPQTVRLPGDEWQQLARQATKSICLQRRFQRPTGLLQAEVRLVIQFTPATATVQLNGQSLGAIEGNGSRLDCSIKAQLQAHNLVQILIHDVGQLATVDELVCDVVLEIDE